MRNLEYTRITSLEELLEVSCAAEDRGRRLLFLAGGTDLMVELRNPGEGVQLAGHRRVDGPCLIADLSGWDSLRELETCEDGSLWIGALCTHAQLEEGLPAWATVLAQAAHSIGSPQIRVRGTVGGNCGNGAPAADTVPALVLLNAQVELAQCHAGACTIQQIPLLEYLEQRDTYRTALILRFFLPVGDPYQTCRFFKQGKRKALAISTVSLAVKAQFSGKPSGRQVEGLTFASGAVTSIPFLYEHDQPLVISSSMSCLQSAREIAEQTIKQMNDRFGERASRSYKQQIITGFLYAFLMEQELEDMA